MPYTQLQDIRLGMDRSRASRVVSELGSAWTIKNAHLTRGGDIQRAKKFVKIDDFPTTTKGLSSINNTLYTNGYDAAQAGNVPSGVNHLLTQHPTASTAMVSVLDTEGFDGELYSIISFDDGNIYHYLGTTRVTDWDTLSTTIGSNSAVASALSAAITQSAAVNTSVASNVVTVTSATAGTSFTIGTSAVNNGSVNDQTITAVESVANVVAVEEVLSSVVITVTGGTSSAGVNKVNSVTVNGVDILGAAVDWVTSNTATAAALKAQMDSYTSSPEYTISVDGPALTITAIDGTGAAPNAFNVVTTVAGDVTASNASTMSNGVTAVSAVAQAYQVTVGGTFEVADQFTVTINSAEVFIVTGGSSGTGTTILTFKSKMYSTASSNLYFCALNAPTQWVSGIDYGFINMASQTAGQEILTAAAEYQGLMAVFSQSQIRVWSISEDSEANVFLQTLQNTGTVAPSSVISYGNNDVFYLSTSGIRSIKARGNSDSAYVSDVGTSIDSDVTDYISTLTDAQVASATAIIEPIDGRYWLAIGTRIYVFSFFPAKKISAWSYYELDIAITNFAIVNDRVYVRATDSEGVESLYLYGGANNDEYAASDESLVVVELPFISANAPAAFKELNGFDIIATNDWELKILPNPDDMTVEVLHGISTGTTYGEPRFGITGFGSLFGITLTCSTAGAATLSALALHYTNKHEDG